MAEDLVPLTSCHGAYQTTMIEGVLESAAIPYALRDGSLEHLAVALGASEMPLGSKVVLVPRDRLQEAKDVLCANGVVCEVSERLLRRAVEEIVKPLLPASSGRDLSRLTRFLEVNNKETVKALLEETLELEGGRDLLEDTFFLLDQEEDLASLRMVARAVGKGARPQFFERLEEAIRSGDLRRQIAFLEVLRELPETPERAAVLALALRSSQAEVREEAEEALFSLGKGDFGYEADGEAEEREAAVERYLDSEG